MLLGLLVGIDLPFVVVLWCVLMLMFGLDLVVSMFAVGCV